MGRLHPRGAQMMDQTGCCDRDQQSQDRQHDQELHQSIAVLGAPASPLPFLPARLRPRLVCLHICLHVVAKS